MRFASTSVACLSLVLAACGGASAPPAAVAPVRTAPAAPAAVALTPVVDWSPVPAPASVVVEVRADRLEQSIASAERLARTPGLRAKLDAEFGGLSRFVDGTIPVRAVVALDPSVAADHLFDDEPLIGFSLALQNNHRELLDVLSLQGFTVQSLDPQRYRLQNASSGLSCTLGVPPEGRARMACATSPSGFALLEPYLLRTLPEPAKVASDASVRVAFAPLTERMLPVARKGLDELISEELDGLRALPFLDPELPEAIPTTANEALLAAEELDFAELSLSVDASKPESVLRGELGFRGHRSWLVTALTDRNERVAMPPEFFWRLPKDSAGASFGVSMNSAHFEGIRRVVGKALRAALAFAPVSDELRSGLIGFVDKLPRTNGAWATASGGLPSVATSKLAADKPVTPKQAVKAAHDIARTWLGWSIISEEGRAEDMIAFFDQAAELYARGTKFARDELEREAQGASAEMRPTFESQRKDLARLPKVVAQRNPAGMPKGTVFYDLSFELLSTDVWDEVHPEKDADKRPAHPKGVPAKETIRLRIAVVPDGGNRYLYGLSLDPDLLKKRLLSSLEGAKREETLAARGDLERLRRPMRGGGFVSYGQLLANLGSLGDDQELRVARSIVDSLPNKGAAPVFVTFGGASGDKPSLTFELVLDKAWMDDLSAALQAASALARLAR